MLKNIYEFKGDIESQDGKVNQFDKIWIWGYNLTEDELKFLHDEFNINVRKAKNICNAGRTHIFSRNPLSFVYTDYYLSGDQVVKYNGIFYMGENFLITLSPQKTETYEAVFRRFENQQTPEPVDVLAEILKKNVETNYDALENIEKELDAVSEDILEQKQTRKKISRIVQIKKDLIEIEKVFWHSIRLLYSFKKENFMPFDLTNDQKVLFDEIYDTFLHQLEIITVQKEVITDSLSVAQTTASNKLSGISKRVNINVKRLILIALVLAGVGVLIAFPNSVATLLGIPYFSMSTAQWVMVIALFFISLAIPACLFWWYWKNLR